VQLENEMKRVYQKSMEDQKQFRKEVDFLKKQTGKDIARLEKELDNIRVAAAEVEVKNLELKRKDIEEKMTLSDITDYILKNFEGIVAQRMAQEEHPKANGVGPDFSEPTS